MNPDAQRIAIAEACGWNHVHYARDLSESVGADCFRGQPPGHRDYYDNVPDYLNDLNAMHEAEKTLKDDNMPVSDRLEYDHQLKLVTCALLGRNAVRTEKLWHSTSAQRAEAFLRTIGKWPTDEN